MPEAIAGYPVPPEAACLILLKVLHINPSDSILYSAVRRGGRKPGALLPDAITGAFTEARALSGIQFSASPPSFHEIRSLASRLYAAENGKEFAQRLPGHKNMSMTKTYLDSRGQEYVMV